MKKYYLFKVLTLALVAKLCASNTLILKVTGTLLRLISSLSLREVLVDIKEHRIIQVMGRGIQGLGE
jgi:hypothetical protein